MTIQIPCNICLRPVTIQDHSASMKCPHCQHLQGLPRLRNESKVRLLDYAAHHRSERRFKEALSAYQKALSYDPEDPEVYWLMALCQYGIVYEEVDGCYEMRMYSCLEKSIYMSSYYKAAIKFSHPQQRSLYFNAAKDIDELFRTTHEAAKLELQYDVFVSCRGLSQTTGNTQDLMLASQLISLLKSEGIRVYAPAVEKDPRPLYEQQPAVMAALHSARILLLVGSKTRSFTSPTVRNDALRYLALMKDGKKRAIAAYRDMTRYDLPEEFAHLEAVDLSESGASTKLVQTIREHLEKN